MTVPGGPGYGQLVTEARRLLDAVAAADVPPDVAARAAALTAEAADLLQPHVTEDESRAPAGNRPDLPALGHPLLPPFVVSEQGDDDVQGTVRLSRAHLGGGAAAHGGVVPLLFDDVLGHLVAYGRSPSRTAYLHVDYRRLTPLGRDLAVRGWIDRTEGRKIWARGELRLGDDVLAEAEGLFVVARGQESALTRG